MRSNHSHRSINCWLLCRTGLIFCLVLSADKTAFLMSVPARQPDTKRYVALPFPDGVIDEEHRTAYVSSPKSGIQAVRLKDGKILWINDESATVPWLVAGDRLIARGERLSVLDLKHDGKRLRECDAPSYPKIEIPERCLVSFNQWDPWVSGETLQARWYAVAQIDRSKGRPFAFEAWNRFNRAAPTGTIKVNLDSGKVDVQSDAKPSDVTTGLMPGAAKPDRLPGELPEKLGAVWQEYHKEQYGRITVIDGQLIGVAMTLEQMGMTYQKRVVLNRWDLKTGVAAEPIELLRGSAQDIANIIYTQDRLHVAVQFKTSAITIYSLTTGKTVGKEIPGVSSPEKCYVDGKRLYQIVQGANQGDQSLKAVELESGEAAWQVAIKPRSTIPLPP